MVGLSIDLGYAFAEKRAVQNSADAAALAGSHALTKWSTSTPTLTANTDVAAMVDANKMNSSTTQSFSCVYVDDSNSDIKDCSNAVPPTATGVRVVVRETHSTFFIRVVPFAPHTITTSATATAHVQGITAGVGSDSPFVVCGVDTKLSSGGKYSILETSTGDVQPSTELTSSTLDFPVASSSQYTVQLLGKGNSTPTPTPTGTSTGGGTTTDTGTIDPGAYGKTYLLHDPQVADCGNKSNSFKGLADNTDNYGLTIPGWFDSKTGDKAGPTRVKVNGINGCAVGTTDPNGCVLIVPIASQASDGKFYVVTIGAFLVSQCHANCHEGVLLKDYQIQPDGLGQWTDSGGWKPGDDGLTTVRLTN